MGKRSIHQLGLDQLADLFTVATDTDEGLEANDQTPEPMALHNAPEKLEDLVETCATHGVVEQIGSWVGPYKLVCVLGEGGMGMVYLAQQERPIKRKVALKVIKPGMDSKRVIARFEAERQALALLDHPNIARVYDAGTTEAGRPYFVMEHVQGVPITEHCDRCKLTIPERLALFLQVCEAVQHAHQKGIIHRDIKPSNVQVAVQGEQVLPKVIDFGVAKAVSQPLTERTLYTEQGQLIGTPEYMSPEQAEMTGQDVDTRSDIYSLGVLLYELLTGILPFDAQTLREGGIDRIRRIIREQEPKTPSTRLSTVSGEESTKLAQLRRTDIRSLGRQLHGDLDWITIRALEKDRMRRYQTAHALAEDIQRHLNHEPVLAGPPSKIYRLKKFIQKNRTQVTATAIAAALLVVIAVISVMLRQSVDRNKEAQSLRHTSILAQARDYRSQGQFKEALAKVDTVLDSEHVGPEAKLLRARAILDVNTPVEAVKELEKLLGERDEIACQAHFLLARIYLENDPGDPETTGKYQRKAKEHQQKGETLFSESAEAYFNRSMMAGTVDKTLEWLNKALDLDPGHYDSLDARCLAYYVLRKWDEMEIDARVMIGIESKNPRGYALRAMARREKAIQQGKQELLSQAIMDHDAAISLSPEDAELYDQRRRTCSQMGNHKQALSDAQKCVRLQPDKGIYHFHLFCALVALGRYDDAKIQYDKIIESGLLEKKYFDGIDDLAAAYVFDIRDAGLSWHPPGNEPNQFFLRPMVEAEEYYDQLRKNGERIVPDGYAPDWSPDGNEVVYARGIIGHSGIEILNLKTKETRLLTPSGRDPSWSPDGEYIVFARGPRRTLIADLTAEHEVENYEYYEVWLIKADGTAAPRFLTKGKEPHWRHKSSKEVFYYAPEPQRICSISIEEGSVPQEIVWSPSGSPKISPDGDYFASAEYRSGYLRVTDRSGSLIVNWPGPTGILFPDWSPDGRELIIGGGWLASPSPGLWVYNMDKKEASQLVSGRGIMKSRLSPDSKQIVFHLEPPFNDIWVIDRESLGPGRTLRDHYQEEVNRLTRRINAYPQVKWSYRLRARSDIFLGNRERILKDLERYADLVGGLNDANEVAEVYSSMAWRLIRTQQPMGGPEIALELMQKAHKMQPNNWNYLLGLGAAYYRTGHWEEAIAHLTESALLGGGENVCIDFFLAMAYWQSNEEDRAKNYYNKAIEWMEDNRTGKIWLAGYDGMIFQLFLETSELMGIEINDLFTHGVLPKL